MQQAIGFLPRCRYEALITNQGPAARPNHRLWIVERNADPVGFLLATPGQPGGSAKVIQVAVREDARRFEHGLALVQTAEAWAQALQRGAVSCAVATDLDARAFWSALGYPVVALAAGGARRGRVLERRVKRLDGGLWLPAAGATRTH